MEKNTGINSKLVVGVKKFAKKKFFKKNQPYLLPCGNSTEYCFLKVRKNNANWCRVWKKLVWKQCRHHIETEKYKWENR